MYCNLFPLPAYITGNDCDLGPTCSASFSIYQILKCTIYQFACPCEKKSLNSQCRRTMDIRICQYVLLSPASSGKILYIPFMNSSSLDGGEEYRGLFPLQGPMASILHRSLNKRMYSLHVAATCWQPPPLADRLGPSDGTMAPDLRIALAVLVRNRTIYLLIRLYTC